MQNAEVTSPRTHEWLQFPISTKVSQQDCSHGSHWFVKGHFRINTMTFYSPQQHFHFPFETGSKISQISK